MVIGCFFVPKKDKFGEERNWEINNLWQSDIQKVASYCFTCVSLITIEMNCPWMYLLATGISFVHCLSLIPSSLEALLFLLINEISIYVTYGYVSM